MFWNKPKGEEKRKYERAKAPEKLPTMEEMVALVQQIQPLRAKALVSFLYLTGARISEVLGDSDRVPAIRKHQLVFEEDEKGNPIFIVRNIFCEKRKKALFRTIAMKTDQYPEAKLVPIIKNWLNFIFFDSNPIFPSNKQKSMSRQHAHYLIKKHCNNYLGIDWYPHLFRHIRLSHLSLWYAFSESSLKKWTGWSKSETAEQYVKLDWRDNLAVRVR